MVVWLLTLVFPVGWALWLAQRTAISPRWLHGLCLVLALGTGGVSLVMLGLGLAGVPLRLVPVLGGYMLLMLPGWGLALRQGLPRPSRLPKQPPVPERLAVLALLIFAAAVLFNGIYWPFYRPDALGIYAPFAGEIFRSGGLVPITPQRNLYELYPQLVPMNYAFAYLLTGWENPYVAKLSATLLGLGVLPVAYLLGRQLFNPGTGLAAALLIALTPDFGNWASAGYVDLPMAFFLGLAVLYGWQMLRQPSLTSAALAGLCTGLACWTKNAGLVAALILSLILLMTLTHRKLGLKHYVLCYGMMAVVAAPWYGRNLLLAGTLTPDTAWTDQAQRTLLTAFSFITLPQNYSVPGAVILVGLALAVWRTVQQRLRGQQAYLLMWFMPFYAAWFIYVSYDPRFVMLFYPVGAVLGAAWVTEAVNRSEVRGWRGLRWWIVGIAGVLWALSLWHSVDYKRALLDHPTLQLRHEEKLAIVQPAE